MGHSTICWLGDLRFQCAFDTKVFGQICRRSERMSQRSVRRVPQEVQGSTCQDQNAYYLEQHLMGLEQTSKGIMPIVFRP